LAAFGNNQPGIWRSSLSPSAFLESGGSSGSDGRQGLAAQALPGVCPVRIAFGSDIQNLTDKDRAGVLK